MTDSQHPTRRGVLALVAAAPLLLERQFGSGVIEPKGMALGGRAPVAGGFDLPPIGRLRAMKQPRAPLTSVWHPESISTSGPCAAEPTAPNRLYGAWINSDGDAV